MHHHLPKVKKTWFKISKKGRVLHCVATLTGCVCLAGPAAAATAFNIDNIEVNITQDLNTNGDTGTVTNTGRIVVGDDNGVEIFAHSDITLSNAGLISSTGTTSSVLGISASLIEDSTISNSGIISVSSEKYNTTGIAADILYSSVISNSGALSVSANSLYSEATGIETGPLIDSTISNSGTISVIADYATGIHADEVKYSSISNSGTLTVDGGYYSTGIQTDELRFDSTISNSGTLTVEAEYYATGIEAYSLEYGSSISNSGTVTVRAGSYADGIVVHSVFDASISNTGELHVSSDGDIAVGIHSEQMSGDSTIENAGLINVEGSRVAVGISAFYMYDNSSVTNSGTIEVTDAEVYSSIVGILNVFGDPGTSITNAGSIDVTGTEGSFWNAGIFAKYNAGAIANSGTITLTQDNPSTYSYWIIPAAGILNLDGSPTINNSGTIQALNSDGSISNHSYSVFSLNGTLTNDATGVLKGLLYVGGSVDNSGLIVLPLPTTTGYFLSGSSGSPTSLSISSAISPSSASGYVGSLNNSGTIGITLVKDGESLENTYSILKVGGEAVLQAGSTIDVNVASVTPHQLFIGETLAGIIQAGSIVTDVDLLNTTDNSALLKFTPLLSHEDTWLDLEIEQDRTILEATRDSGRNGVTGTAAALDSLTDTDDPDLSDFISDLYGYETDEEVADAVVQASPVNATTSPTVVSGLLRAMNTVVRARLLSVRGFNSGDQMFSDQNLWLKPYGGYTEQDDRDGINGFDADSYGFGLGADGEYTTGKRLGLAFFYTGVDVDIEDVNQENEMDVFNLMAYGSNPLYGENTELFYQVGGGLQKTDSSRYIAATDDTATADFTSQSLFAQAKGSKTIAPNERLKTMFSLGLSYSYFHNPSYQESGAGGLDLDVESFDGNALVASLEGDVFYDLGAGFQLLGSAAIGYDLIDDDTTVNANFLGDTTVSFATEGIDNSPFIFNAGLGLAKNIQDNLSVDLKYDVDGRSSDYVNQAVTAQLTWKF